MTSGQDSSNEHYSAMGRLRMLRTNIDNAVSAYFESHGVPEQLKNSKRSVEAYEIVREFALRPSKRLRGAMVAASYTAFGGANTRAATDIAVATELYHNYLLMVDDVMDRSAMRRGGDAVHIRYRSVVQAELSDVLHPEHTSDMLAISAGLVTQHIASSIMSTLDEDPERVLRTYTVMHGNLGLTCYGQIEDLCNVLGTELAAEEVLRIDMFKSSFYTFVNPLHVGAALAGAETESIHQIINEFGVPAGIVFQLQDDILGIVGDEKSTGKSHLDDLQEGKMTYLMRTALTNADEKQAELLRSKLGDEHANEQDRAEVVEILEATGALEQTRQKINESAEQARMALKSSEWPEDLRLFLDGLLEYSMSRKW